VLNLSVKTAETHRSNIMSKLGLHSVSELVLYAVRNNIVQAFSSPSLGGDASDAAPVKGSDLPPDPSAV